MCVCEGGGGCMIGYSHTLISYIPQKEAETSSIGES